MGKRFSDDHVVGLVKTEEELPPTMPDCFAPAHHIDFGAVGLGLDGFLSLVME